MIIAIAANKALFREFSKPASDTEVTDFLVNATSSRIGWVAARPAAMISGLARICEGLRFYNQKTIGLNAMRLDLAVGEMIKLAPSRR